MNNTISSFSLTPSPKQFEGINYQDSESSSTDSSANELMESFGNTLSNKLNQVESLQQESHSKMKQFASGQIDDVHDVSVAMQKANMGINIATSVRKKVLDSLQTLQQMG